MSLRSTSGILLDLQGSFVQHFSFVDGMPFIEMLSYSLLVTSQSSAAKLVTSIIISKGHDNLLFNVTIHDLGN